MNSDIEIKDMVSVSVNRQVQLQIKSFVVLVNYAHSWIVNSCLLLLQKVSERFIPVSVIPFANNVLLVTVELKSIDYHNHQDNDIEQTQLHHQESNINIQKHQKHYHYHVQKSGSAGNSSPQRHKPFIVLDLVYCLEEHRH